MLAALLHKQAENAIMVVEDEVTCALGLVRSSAALYSMGEMVFDQLAARSEGRLASQVALPDAPRFAASLLILRESMHHLNFDKVTVLRAA